MVKKKASGQTITIIILAVMLLLTVCFGGVYAYYSSTTNRVAGVIEMANLNITMQTTGTGESGSSILVLSNGLVVPGQTLENTPLLITNQSNTKTYLAVVYKVLVRKGDTTNIDVGSPKIDIVGNNGYWYDYLYTAKDSHGQTQLDENGNELSVHCLVTTREVLSASNDNGDIITVIGENCLRLPTSWGNEFQSMSISFTFQAFAIGADMDEFDFADGTTQDEKCEKIMQTIYTAFDYNIPIMK